MHNLAR